VQENLQANAGDMVIAKMIRRLRRDREVSQAQLAVAIDQGRNVVSRIEIGQRQTTLPELHLICEFLGIPLQDFVSEYLRRIGSG